MSNILTGPEGAKETLAQVFTTLAQVFTLRPYRFGSAWVFDDPDRGLRKEGLVGGVPEILLTACRRFGVERPELGFTMLLSDEPFPDTNVVLSKIGPEGSGTVYEWEGMKGWLCANLRLYFDPPPEKLFMALKGVKHSRWTRFVGWLNGM